MVIIKNKECWVVILLKFTMIIYKQYLLILHLQILFYHILLK